MAKLYAASSYFSVNSLSPEQQFNVFFKSSLRHFNIDEIVVESKLFAPIATNTHSFRFIDW